MADPLSVSASVVGIAVAGVKVSISLFALAETVNTGSETVIALANDISSTCGILNQLRDLITPQPGTDTSIFNSTALRDIVVGALNCRIIFDQLNTYLKRATNQIKDLEPQPNDKVKLSRSERAKWPFLDPHVNELHSNLRDAKSNLLLMVAVANLAVAQKNGFGRQVDDREKSEMRAAIVQLQKTGTVDMKALDLEDDKVEGKEKRLNRLFKKIGAWGTGRKPTPQDLEDDGQEESDEAKPPVQSNDKPVEINGPESRAVQPSPVSPTFPTLDPVQPMSTIPSIAPRDSISHHTPDAIDEGTEPEPGPSQSPRLPPQSQDEPNDGRPTESNDGRPAELNAAPSRPTTNAGHPSPSIRSIVSQIPQAIEELTEPGPSSSSSLHLPPKQDEPDDVEPVELNADPPSPTAPSNAGQPADQPGDQPTDQPTPSIASMAPLDPPAPQTSEVEGETEAGPDVDSSAPAIPSMTPLDLPDPEIPQAVEEASDAVPSDSPHPQLEGQEPVDENTSDVPNVSDPQADLSGVPETGEEVTEAGPSGNSHLQVGAEESLDESHSDVQSVRDIQADPSNMPETAEESNHEDDAATQASKAENTDPDETKTNTPSVLDGEPTAALEDEKIDPVAGQESEAASELVDQPTAEPEQAPSNDPESEIVPEPSEQLTVAPEDENIDPVPGQEPQDQDAEAAPGPTDEPTAALEDLNNGTEPGQEARDQEPESSRPGSRPKSAEGVPNLPNLFALGLFSEATTAVQQVDVAAQPPPVKPVKPVKSAKEARVAPPSRPNEPTLADPIDLESGKDVGSKTSQKSGKKPVEVATEDEPATDATIAGPANTDAVIAEPVITGPKLQAWTSSVIPGLTTGEGRCITIVELSISDDKINELLEQQPENYDILIALEKLNTYQRSMVTRHAQRRRATVLFVKIWRNEKIPTVFGDLDVQTLLWVTKAPRRIRNDQYPPYDRYDEVVRDEAWYEQNPRAAQRMRKMKERARQEAEAKEKSAEPIKFRDAMGRKFTFPWHLVKEWKGMEDLVKIAFLHVDVIGPHVHDGHYDLVSPHGEVILPQTWESVVRPGWDITMQMWPMPEPPRPPPVEMSSYAFPSSPPPLESSAPEARTSMEGEKPEATSAEAPSPFSQPADEPPTEGEKRGSTGTDAVPTSDLPHEEDEVDIVPAADWAPDWSLASPRPRAATLMSPPQVPSSPNFSSIAADTLTDKAKRESSYTDASSVAGSGLIPGTGLIHEAGTSAASDTITRPGSGPVPAPGIVRAASMRAPRAASLFSAPPIPRFSSHRGNASADKGKRDSGDASTILPFRSTATLPPPLHTPPRPATQGKKIDLKSASPGMNWMSGQKIKRWSSTYEKSGESGGNQMDLFRIGRKGSTKKKEENDEKNDQIVEKLLIKWTVHVDEE
ncbi:hypothetical protein P280DRAFT_469358 [Massarina eburnea CBS 473.64]|uniref:Ubiquitin-like domain-containing protein n=1 Tax=Massarina eburnea CBS 473.64 TaxID=1395130 RepID=A0A6A6RZ73_9PLEO|nr:hypothetical protein P280DRAFT_469358 [Massarina eburnea CBS 473.64]